MNTMKPSLLIIFFLAVFVWSCEDTETEGFVSKPVIEGYLYEGTPVQHVAITELTPYEDLEDQDPQPLSGLDITLTVDGTDYVLEEDSPGSGSYGLPDNSFRLSSGQSLELSCVYNSLEIYSHTRVPSLPQDVTLSDTVKYISPITTLRDLEQFSDISVEINWSNTDNSYYFVLVENLEEEPERINQIEDAPEIEASFSSPPTITDYEVIWMDDIPYYGLYRVVVYKTNTEYADLYQSQYQNPKTLNEPASNVLNGYGIFTAFASDTVYFAIRKP